MRLAKYAGLGTLLGVLAATDLAAEVADIAAAPTTLMKFLGIPQGIDRIRDATVNRNGNNPGLERKDPLLRIADPENLESDNPAIKTAAKIKTDKDLAKQKIKAIKHLASVGCGCYPGVAESLLAALGDCTEEVRYEAAVAFCQASGSPCDACGQSCCNAEVMQKLHEMAFGTDAQGCSIEQSPRVRAAARMALGACLSKMPAGAPSGDPLEDPVDGPKEVPVGTAFGSPVVNPLSLTALSGFREAVPDDEGDWPSGAKAVNGGSPVYPKDGRIRAVGGRFGLASMQVVDPVQPVQPQQPFGPLAGPMPPAMLGDTAGGQQTGQLLDLALQKHPASPMKEAVLAPQAASMARADLAGVLQESSTVQSVEVQRRSPVAMDPNVRGFKAGQVYTQANGVYWTPARRDLDTMLSKIDPGMIQNVVVIPGPYGLKYGPGFAFIDVVRQPTPRYACGPEIHFDTSGNIRTNGGQFYGRETAYGGSDNWGFRFSYGQRRGSDYTAGNGQHIPSSYHNRDAWGEISYDISRYQRVDFAYQRLDQTDTEYAGQFFDVNFLVTNGFELRLTDEDPSRPWTRFTVTGWYNRTNFNGDTSRKNNPEFPVLQRVEFALDNERGGSHRLAGTTNGAVASSGVRTAMTFGETDDTHFTVGADFRYLAQDIREDFVLFRTPPLVIDPLRWTTNMPHSWLSDPGAYAEWSSPLTDAWTLSLGGRIDFVSTRAQASDLRDAPSLPGGDTLLDQNDTLYAFYVTNEFELNRHWTVNAGFGQAQRPPTLVERYADALFLSLVQSGFSRVIGDPRLVPERNWQVDVGLSADFDNWRGKANYFYSWINDYITFADDTVVDFADARLLRFVNTRLATLTGFELAGEFDLFPRLSAFGKMSYVEGQDQVLDAPLPSIPPLNSTVGLRLHDADKGRCWGLELAARIVNTQNRLGAIRLRGGTGVLEERTPGFTVWHLRGYYNYTKNLSLIAGIDNLFDKNYQEHLDLRLLGPTGFPAPTTRVLSPGFTPYFALKWIY